MVIVKGGSIRVRLFCDRCGSSRHDKWHPKTGAIDGRSYDPSKEYQEVLTETRADVRVGLIAKGKPQPISAEVRKTGTTPTGARDGGKGTALQLVPGKRKGRVRNRADRGTRRRSKG
jgi:hypothetical protein